jgi:O-antigen/teichoic acid export membrane protein
MELAARAARGAVTTLGWQAGCSCLQLAAAVVLARLIAPREVGLVAMAVAVLGLGELVRDLGLSTAAAQARTLTAAQRSNLFWLSAAAGLAMAAIAWLMARPIAALYGEEALVTVIRCLALNFVWNGVAAPFKAELGRRLRFSALGLAETAARAVALPAAVAVALHAPGYWALIVQQWVHAALGAALVVLLAGWRPSRPERAPMGGLLRFGACLAGTQSIVHATRNIDDIAIGCTWGAAALGLYGRAFQLVMMPAVQAAASMTRVAVPVLARLPDDDRVLRYARTAQTLAAAPACAAYGMIAGLAEPAVAILFGEPWLGMAPIVQALALAGVFRTLSQVPYWILVARGLTGSQLRFHLLGQPAIVALLLAGLPWGGAGVALGLALGHALFWLAQLRWLGRLTALPTATLAADGLVVLAVVGLPAAGISWLVAARLEPPWLQVALAAALVAAYLAALLGGCRRQRREVWRLIRAG